ncbi:hypothetical protein CAEBREN_04589 [Caenorhabditis brenneri]|uniref:MATH domain-containing protein n=1 Tax=Caenorhabditis brenneri TaxID=135651 RepID=G0MV37_CAEBE|nr:hypothetical protein CAEBREN_04589 [Caenorhabditis brenneri]
MNQKTRSFVLKHVFKNVSTMKDSENLISSSEDHFGVPWFIDIWHKKDYLGVYLHCRRTENKKKWSIGTEYEIHVLHPNGNSIYTSSAISHCFTKPTGHGQGKTMTWERMEKEFLLNDELVVEICVKIGKITGIEDFHLGMSGTDDKLYPVEKQMNQEPRSFVLKNVFKNVPNMKDNEDCYGLTEDHFGVPWFISICNKKEHLGVFLHCNRSEKEKEWSIDTEFEIHILNANGKPAHKTSGFSYCFTEAIGYGPKLMEWKKMEKEFLFNDELIVEIRVKIIQMTGIEDFHLNMSGTNDTLSTFQYQMNRRPRSFVLTHVFKNVSKMRGPSYGPFIIENGCIGLTEEYFGVPW